MSDITHRTIETNGIRMHIAEAGKGHSSSSFTVSRTPGIRGATSSRPLLMRGTAPLPRTCAATARRSAPGGREYTMLPHRGRRRPPGRARREDGGRRRPRLGCAYRLDCGSAARTLPCRGRPQCALHPPRGAAPPDQLMRQMFADIFFYILYFQEPGRRGRTGSRRAQARCAFFYGISGDAPRGTGLAPKPKEATGFLTGCRSQRACRRGSRKRTSTTSPPSSSAPASAAV